MKTLKQLREEYDDNILTQVIPEELVLEDKQKSYTSGAKAPSPGVMPAMLLFRRVSYKQFPGRNYVALYYSKMLDKYLSIPFGPEGNLNLSEAVIHDTLDEDWQSVNRKDKTDGLSQAAVDAYRRENPGSKLKTAVTEKNPKGKRASRRKSFCARMGGMKARLTSAKTARDPDSNINKALRRWNCEESFRAKLEEKRQERLDEILPALVAGGEALLGMAARSAVGSAVRGAASSVARRGVGKTIERGITSVGGKGTLKAARKIGSGVKKVGQVAKYAGKEIIKGMMKSGEKGDGQAPAEPRTIELNKPEIQQKSSWETRSTADPIYKSRMKTQSMSPIKENKISNIRKMLDEGTKSIDLPINGRTVTLNNSMAKRILEVYDSVNTKNKKIVESMLNEDLESFKKLLNFSIRN